MSIYDPPGTSGNTFCCPISVESTDCLRASSVWYVSFCINSDDHFSVVYCRYKYRTFIADDTHTLLCTVDMIFNLEFYRT